MFVLSHISPDGASWLGMLQHFLWGTSPCVGACEISSNQSTARQCFMYLTYMTMHTAARNLVSNRYTVNKNPTKGKTSEHTQVRLFYTVHHHIQGISSRDPAYSIYLKMLCVVPQPPSLDYLWLFKVRRHLFSHLFCCTSRRLGHEKTEIN